MTVTGGAVCGGLRAPQVLARIPGLTYRQLDYWSRTGRISPHVHEHGGSGSGIPYCWPLGQIEVAARMFQLTQLGFNLNTATELAHNPGRLTAVLAGLARLASSRPVRAVRQAG